jgi:hypothetical protein
VSLWCLAFFLSFFLFFILGEEGFILAGLYSPFEKWSDFMPRPSWTSVFLFVLSRIVWMTVLSHCAQPLVEMESHLGQPWTMILLSLCPGSN